MIMIRTAEELARAIDGPPDADLAHLLDAHCDRPAKWAYFPLEELALFVIGRSRRYPVPKERICILLLSGNGLMDRHERRKQDMK